MCLPLTPASSIRSTQVKHLNKALNHRYSLEGLQVDQRRNCIENKEGVHNNVAAFNMKNGAAGRSGGGFHSFILCVLSKSFSFNVSSKLKLCQFLAGRGLLGCFAWVQIHYVSLGSWYVIVALVCCFLYISYNE